MQEFETMNTRAGKSPLIANIWAVGRNYADHAKELGNLVPAPAGDPMVFLKAGSGALGNEAIFHLPSFTQDIHHEVEIALRFNSQLQFSHITVSIDLTAREVQNKLKTQGHPWTLAKSFRESSLLGPIVPLTPGLNLQNLDFSLKVNGELRQSGNTKDMIHNIEKLRQFIVERFPVVEGDFLMTGTPAGVSALKPGDQLEAEIKDLKGPGGSLTASWQVAQKS
jgi:acylpyruvate hydrolase